MFDWRADYAMMFREKIQGTCSARRNGKVHMNEVENKLKTSNDGTVTTTNLAAANVYIAKEHVLQAGRFASVR